MPLLINSSLSCNAVRKERPRKRLQVSVFPRVFSSRNRPSVRILFLPFSGGRNFSVSHREKILSQRPLFACLHRKADSSVCTCKRLVCQTKSLLPQAVRDSSKQVLEMHEMMMTHYPASRTLRYSKCVFVSWSACSHSLGDQTACSSLPASSPHSLRQGVVCQLGLF